MGAGVSQKVINDYYYRRLKKIQRELTEAGVTSQYARFTLHGVSNEPKGNAFRISYDTLRASNGETFGMMKVSIHYNGVDSFYDTIGEGPQAIERIKALFSASKRYLYE